VSAMKVTPNAAMRARDVSRPRPEQLAAGEAAEGAEAKQPGGPRDQPAPAPGIPATGPDGGTKGAKDGAGGDAGRGRGGRDGARAEGGSNRAGQDRAGQDRAGQNRESGKGERARRRRHITRGGRGR
jgi:hypothetical protein